MLVTAGAALAFSATASSTWSASAIATTVGTVLTSAGIGSTATYLFMRRSNGIENDGVTAPNVEEERINDTPTKKRSFVSQAKHKCAKKAKQPFKKLGNKLERFVQRKTKRLAAAAIDGAKEAVSEKIGLS